jgi:hypothetical protein
MLYHAINKDYLMRLSSYYYFYLATTRKANDSSASPQPYLEKDGEFIRCYHPLLGDLVRDMYDEASSNSDTHWGISDHDRHTREIQRVGSEFIFAQDHTHQVTKNYYHKKKLGVEAMWWTVSNESGKIACAVLVPSTKTTDFSHAAKQLLCRDNFNPKVMYSNTWPCKSNYWTLLLGEDIQG